MSRIEPTKARQGRRGWQVLVVLDVALILAMIAWGIAEIYGTSIAPENPTVEPGPQIAPPETPQQ